MAVQVIREHEGWSIDGWWVVPLALVLMPSTFFGMSLGVALAGPGPTGALSRPWAAACCSS
ncbi:MAG: hypothetical protein R3B82_25305 [Sandaracinaceae bacterium]